MSRFGVLDLLLPAAVMGMMLWTLPPTRAGIIFAGMFLAPLAPN